MPKTITIPVGSISSDWIGFSQIADISSRMDAFNFTDIRLDMRQMTWFDGNMCAPLGAILYRSGRNLNNLALASIPSKVEELLCKNGFLTNYGRAKRIDTFETTIQYRRFEPHDDKVFNYYIDEQFRNKAIPDMSKALHKKFLEGLMEIFLNAASHSETKMGIFVCGQSFPKKQRLDFTIADLGINKIGLKLPAEKANHWALEGNNTTRRGPIPGGLGLKILRKFIQLNQGRLQVISDYGYWEQHPDGTYEMSHMVYRFPGTVVNIEINTAYQNSYILSTEKTTDILF